MKTSRATRPGRPLLTALISLLAAMTSATGSSQPEADAIPEWKAVMDGWGGKVPFRQLALDTAGARHAQVGDINGDGKNDVVIFERNEHLSWFEYPGLERHLIREDAFSCDRFSVADMDGDGDVDVVVNKGGDDFPDYPIYWYRNPLPDRSPTDPSAWEEHLVGPQGGYSKDLMVADINRDGLPDVIARCHEYTGIHFQKDDGAWSFRKIPHPNKEGMALGDLDQDGDIDIILNGFWLETPADPERGDYVQHTIAEKWFNEPQRNFQDNSASVAVADVNGDGRPDVLLSHSEKIGWPIAWYSTASPDQVKTGPWQEHIIASRFDWCETLQVGDVDGDGTADVVVAEFERPKTKNPKMTNAPSSPPYPVVAYFNVKGDATTWVPQRIGDTGAYAATLGDVGSDGDLDVVGPHSFFTGGVDLWENLHADGDSGSKRSIAAGGSSSARFPLDRWHYIQIDDERTKRFFGLVMGDLTGDGFQDIAAGHWFYRNPGGDMTGSWHRVALPEDMDPIAFIDVNGNDRGDLIALRPNAQYWLEARDREGGSWEARQIGSLPVDDHNLGSQNYAIAQIVPGGQPEVIIGAAGGIWYLQIPAQPENGSWPATHVTSEGGRLRCR